jgi:hypothetical protein
MFGGLARGWLVRAAAALVLVSGLAACGGGGGGGGGASSAKLAVTEVTGADSSAYEGEMVPSLIVQMRVTEGADSLSGKTLYISAELPDGQLFQPVPSVSLHSDGLGGTLQLIGENAPVGAKTYSGTLTVRVCLDSACNTPLSVSGGQISYRIEVKPGLVLSTDEAELSAGFGVMPASTNIDVALPDDVISWKIEPTHGAYFSSFKVEPVEDERGAHVRVTPLSLWLPDQGAYEHATITAVTASGATLVRGLELRQTTGPVSERYWAFQQPTVAFTVSETTGGDGVYNSQQSNALLPRRDSDRFHHLSTSYEWPAQANGNPMRNMWLSANLFDEGTTDPTDSYYINLTASRCYSSDCLPQGSYKAVMHFRYSPEGAAEELVDLEVTLNVTP